MVGTERRRNEDPAIADVDGTGNNDVVVAGQNGMVYAYDAAGNLLPGWPARALGAVDSSPAVGDLDGNGRNEVVVGSGSLDVPNSRGGVTVVNPDGSVRCTFLTPPSQDGLTADGRTLPRSSSNPSSAPRSSPPTTLRAECSAGPCRHPSAPGSARW